MRKIEITVEETLKYTHRFTIETELNDASLEKIMDSAERQDLSAADVPYEFEKHGAKVVGRTFTHYSSPDNVEMEITDYIEVKK